MTSLGLLAMGLSLRIAISDLYARRVPNAWLVGACALALPLIVAGQFSGPHLPWWGHLLGAALGLASLLPFYALGWMGAGDVKFFAVLGLMLGWNALLPIWIAASLVAGLHAVLVISTRRVMPWVSPRLQLHCARWSAHWQARPAIQHMHLARQGRQGIPYAAYLAFAAIGWVAASTLGVLP
ncbi:prepilin peptidase [Stenotrophomonas sp.]|uniref:A24 family peptidase n=1 Tax=Stenotrophomonas sp. TaxID=69392 RepID=UPI0028AF030C|nr:prepilin peptidase [Stenotrophomonas sp.]